VNTFQPSPYSYGSDEAAAAAAAAATAPAVTESYIPQDAIASLRTFLGLDDPQIGAARVEAQIRNLQALIPTSTGPLKTYRLNQISKLQAELTVLRAQAAESAYSTELTRVVRVSTAAGSVLGALAVLGGIFFVGGLVVNQVQRARVQQAELQRLRQGS
jgi:hypothetical protein